MSDPYSRLKEIVTDHGEAHVVLEDHDEELEVRLGQVEWHDSDETFTLYTPSTVDGYPIETFDADRAIRVIRPTGIWH